MLVDVGRDDMAIFPPDFVGDVQAWNYSILRCIADRAALAENQYINDCSQIILS